MPAIFEGLQQHRDCGDLPPRTYIRLRRHQLKFHIEGRFVGQYDRHRKLRRVVFLFRDTEEEISRKFILDTALSQTKIFPWSFDPDSNLLTIDRRWFAYLGLPNDGDTISAETFFSLVHPDDRKALSQAFANRLAGEPAPKQSPTGCAAGTGLGNGSRSSPSPRAGPPTVYPTASQASARASRPTRRSKDACAKRATRPARTTG